MKKIDTVDAVGHVLCHDMTQIIKGEYKDAIFRKGHVVTEEDIPVLLRIGKEHLYVWEQDEAMLHEDDAAKMLADLCKNENMKLSEPKEGKIDLFATEDGLLEVDVERLRSVNMTEDLMIATRYSFDPIKKGEKIAGTRIIPLVIEKERLEAAVAPVQGEPLLKLHPFRKLRAGVIATGSELFHGRITDKFTPVIKEKLLAYGSEVVMETIVDDKKEEIIRAIEEMKAGGAEFILCTGGMSVDYDDKTPGAIKESGASIVTYGAPVLPGSMFLLGYFEDGVPIVGLPGCVMYNKTTIFDLILPRLLADIKVTREEISGLGHGGLCLNCEVCHWPICGFGKGV